MIWVRSLSKLWSKVWKSMYEVMEKIYQLKKTYQAGLPPILTQFSMWSLSERCPEIDVNISLYLWSGLLKIFLALPVKVETQGLRWPARRREGRSWGKKWSWSRRLDPRVRGEEQVRTKRGRTGDSWESESFSCLEQIHPRANMSQDASFICGYNNWCVVKHLV